MAKRKICVVTGSRAEYGLLYWLLKGLQDDADIVLQLVVTGMHLSPEFGLTYRAIEEDGFVIDVKVDMLLSGDTPAAITKSIGLGCMGLADAFERLDPDIVVLLGDRFEILAAAQAAMVSRIVIGHIHGGEATEGVIDEAIRHAVTKMAHLHFVSAEPYRRRVIQMGEHPDRVFTVGALGLDNISRLDLLDRPGLEAVLGMRLGKPSILVTYHPVTLSDRDPAQPMRELLSALDAYPEASIIITYPNADIAGRGLIRLIEDYAAARPNRVLAAPSLGQLKYLSALRQVDVIVGNSSSALIEAPSLKTATVNLGDRQKGRLRPASVIDCQESAGSIRAAIDKALSPSFQITLQNMVSLFGDGHAAPRIVARLKAEDLSGLIMKSFYDLPVDA